MAIRTLRDSASPEVIEDELDFTEARLLAEPATADLAPPFGVLVEQCAARQAERRVHSKALTRVEARVVYADFGLDGTTRDIAQRMSWLVQRQWDDPRWRRYFPDGSPAIVRLGLESQVRAVRTWPAALGGEGDEALAALGQQLAGQLTEADAVLAARREANEALANWRIRTWQPFVEDVNAARRSLFGELTSRAADAKRPADWPRTFFLRG